MKKLALFIAFFFTTHSAFAAVTFDGANDVIGCGSSASIDNLDTQGGGGLTLSAWINPTGLGEGSLGCIIRKGSLLSDSGQYTFQITTGNVIRFQKDCSTSDMTMPSAADQITIGVWQHVLVTWDGSVTAANAHIYVNNVEVSYGTPVDGAGSVRSDAALNFNIGNGDGTSITFAGGITEVVAFNKIVSADERAQLYGYGTPLKFLPASIDRGSVKGYWPMNEAANGVTLSTGNFVKDWSGNSNHGTQSGSPVGLTEILRHNTQIFNSSIYSGSVY